MRFHVLLCSHNGALFIEQQLVSIMGQMPCVDHVHVHDFASRDETCAIVDRVSASSIQDKGPGVSLVKWDDAPGASLSFFRALAHLAPTLADEDVVFLCDQDDVWLPGKVGVIRAEVDRLLAGGEKSFVVFHDVKVVDADLSPMRQTYYTGNPFALPRDLASDRVLLANPMIGHTMAVSGRLVRDAMDCLGSRKDYLMHDWALGLMATRTGEVRFVPAALSLYRQHANNILGAYGRRTAWQIVRRTFVFALGLVRQNRAFAGDMAAWVRPGPEGRVARLTGLDLALQRVRFSGILTAGLLAGCALMRGPTPQRRLLGFALLAAGLWQAVGRPEKARKAG